MTVACNKTSTTVVCDAAMAINFEGQDAATVDDSGASPDTTPTTNTLAGLPTPQQITVTTVYKAPLVVEGLTADSSGNLYVPGRGNANQCPVWRVPAAGGSATVVGNLPPPCTPSGLAFNAAGDLFVADVPDRILKLTPNDQTPPTATVFATGVPGANGIAFDRAGSLWVSDGATAQGRVWKVTSDGTATEIFRVQALANDVNAVAPADGGADSGTLVGGIGRDPRALPPGSINITATTRGSADLLGSQSIVANGLAFAPDGSLYVADTGRGALWKVVFDAQGAVKSSVGCDTTFTPNTLCLENVFLAHPMLEGVDGIVVDAAGNIWGAANERNAIVVVTQDGHIKEVFRNPPNATTRLRNGGPFEFPTSPIFVDKKLCLSQSDVSRRDNAPNTGGEVGPGIAGPLLGKVSCIDQAMPQAGLALPVH